MVENLKCMYCAEMGITNPDVFIEIVDVELGAGWICKECFIESEKEKDEHLKELEAQLERKEQIIEKLKEKHNAMCKSCPKNISCDECSNNTTLKILNGENV